jgi:hypothetical protein
MSTQATSKFKIDGWEEHPYLETENGGKLTRAHVKQTFDGDIDGRGEVEWLMCYRPDNTADFVGLQHIVGRVQLRAPLGGQPSLTLTYHFEGRGTLGT